MMIEQTIELHRKGYKYREEHYTDLFKLDNWRESESYKLIKKYCPYKSEHIFEIGCLTGHHLILLAEEGYLHLKGIDFVEDAIEWAKDNSKQYNIDFETGLLQPTESEHAFDKIILFDVLEHQDNVKDFLDIVKTYCSDKTEILILVPKEEHYFDECHINFYPTEKALSNILKKYFEVVEVVCVEEDKKIFARCKICQK